MLQHRCLRVLCFLVVAVLVAALYAEAQPGGGAGLLRQYQQLLADAKGQGQDTRPAEQLALQSRQLAQRGNMQQAQQLLQQAVDLLKRAGAQPAPRASGGGGSAPVFVCPFTHHYSGPGGYYPSAAEVRQIASFFHQYSLPGVLFFDGILIERLQREDPALLRQINEWQLPLGYHGEETHGPYPVPSDLFAEVYPLREAQGFSGQWSLTTGLEWAEAVRQTTERYSHHLPWVVDETTRMLDRRREARSDLSRVGGLALVQQAFGRDVCMMPSHALESAPEGYAFRRMSGFGLDQPAVPIAAHALRIYRLDAYLDAVMAIAGADTSIFWHMGRLTTKGDEVGETGDRLAPTRAKLEQLDRTHPRLLLMGFSKLQEVEAGRTVRYLSEDFFPRNPGSGWVSGETLASHFEPEKGYAPTASDLHAVSEALVRSWQGRPPDLVSTPGREYSLCDAYEGLAQALAEYAAFGKLPGRVQLGPLYGPVTRDGRAALRAACSLPPAAVAAAARSVLRAWPAAGGRFVPVTVPAEGLTLNAAEFLYAMAAAYQALEAGATAPLRVPPATLYPPYGDLLDKIYRPRAVEPLCYTKGQLWTVKPARVPETVAAAGPPAPPGVPSAAATARRLRMVFASNLGGGGRCYREEPFGADLYSVSYDLAGGQATDLRRLTSTPATAEWFPALAPDGSCAVYNATSAAGPRGAANSLRAIELAGGADAVLADNGRFPCFSPDGRSLVFSRSEGPVHRLLAAAVTREGGTLRLGPLRTVADERLGLERVEDPCFFPSGKHLVFHLKQEARTPARLGLIGLDGSGFGFLTPPVGGGHATTCPEGNSVAYTQSSDGQAMVIAATGGAWGRPEPLPLSTRPADYAAYDARYAGVAQVRASYLEWVAPDLLLVTSHGSDPGGKFSFARLYLLQLPSAGGAARVHDLSGAIEKLAGVTGRDFCTADAVVVR